MKKQSQNEADILGLISRMQQQLYSLDKKVDTLISRSLPQAKPAFPQSVNHAPAQGREKQNDPHPGRQMHRATCADCKKECELPFKPTGDRPVYCKECFSHRKFGNTFKAPAENKPKETPPFQAVVNAAVNTPEPSVKEKKKSSAAKKPIEKKKLPPKKKKK